MLYITRETGYADRLRAYTIELDRKNIGHINAGETKSFEVKPGQHSIRLKIDWASSRKIDFILDAKKDSNFKCWSPFQGSKFLLGLFYVIFIPRRCIELKQI